MPTRPGRDALGAEGMSCPSCEAEMARGAVELRASRASLFAFGHSPQAAWFAPAGGGRDARVLGAVERRSGWHCETCGALLLDGEAPLRCFECDAIVPGSARHCPECGWSYESTE